MLYQQIIKIAKSVRAAESLLLTGFIIIGGIYSLMFISSIKALDFILLFCISYSLMLSVYTANALLGKKHDKINPRLKSLTLFTSNYYLILTILLYSFSAILCLLFYPKTIGFQIAIFVLCFIYAIPGFGKHLPLMGTFFHFFVGIIQFNFAFLFFAPISIHSFLISLYFALIFSAGHLHHEVIDYEADFKNKIKSSAVKWGFKTIEKASYSVFALAHLYLIALLLLGIAELKIFFIFIVGFILHSIFFFYYFQQIDKGITIRTQYRLSYRIIYFICGLIFLGMILIA